MVKKGREQAATNDWNEDTRDQVSIGDGLRARNSDISGDRSGSQSNEGKSSQGH